MKSRNKIRYVFLDYDKFLYDYEFIKMKPIERGIYWTLILQLYSSGGYLELNEKVYRMCNCTKKQFENAWKTIGSKFSRKKNKIFHKKVIKELAIARSRSQMLSDKGLRGANARWRKNAQTMLWQSTGNANENEKRSEMNENMNMKRIEKNETRQQDGCANGIDSANKKEDSSISSVSRGNFSRFSNSAHSSSHTAEQETTIKNIEIARITFLDRLNHILAVRTRSDRTAFNNICDFLADGCRCGKFNMEIFDRAIDLAKEAKGGQNPNALFMSLVQKELGYKKKKECSVT